MEKGDRFFGEDGVGYASPVAEIGGTFQLSYQGTNIVLNGVADIPFNIDGACRKRHYLWGHDKR